MRALRGISIIALSGALVLGACTEHSDRVYFEGNYYPTKSKYLDKGDRQSFQTNVRRASKGIKGARQAGRYGGTQFCLKNFGTSQIEWIVGPDAEDSALVVKNGNLVLKGRCVTW